MHGVQPQTTHVNASGKNLRRLLRGKPPRTRAQAAAKLVLGGWQFTHPLPAQAARLCQVHPATSARYSNGAVPSGRWRTPPSIAWLPSSVPIAFGQRLIGQLGRRSRQSEPSRRRSQSAGGAASFKQE